MISRALSAAVLLLLVCRGAESAATAAPAPPQPPAHSAPASAVAVYHEQGRRIYNFRCYYCHGYSGNGKTLASSYLAPRPLDFTRADPRALGRSRMLGAIRNGRPGTAMKGFEGILSSGDIEAVADFVRWEFMLAKAENTRYHTVRNGWPNHDRYAVAFPFASGEIPLDTPWEKLTRPQRQGKRLFLSSCVSCHDRSRVLDPGKIWDASPLSYPRNRYFPISHIEPPVDATTGASSYAIHGRSPTLRNPSSKERRGEALYQRNCAFCHAPDGTGRNWIGSFLQPHPRNLTDSRSMGSMTEQRLKSVIRDGLPGTSMPAWKSMLKDEEIDAIIAYISRVFHPIKRAEPDSKSGPGQAGR